MTATRTSPQRVRRAQFWLAGDEDLESVTRALERVQQQREKRTLLPPPEPMFPKAAATPPVVNQGWWRVCTLLLLSTAAAATVVFTPGRIPSLGLNNDDFSLDKWATAEAKVAWNHILANIGPAAGAWDGIVIASPSTGQNNEPDYFYTWTRDAALTISSLLPEFLPSEYLRPWELSNSTAHSTSHPLLEGLVRSFVSSQSSIQANPNPSGDLWSGGLSEPKFTTQGEPFTGDWGRPQRDGPALRALALIPYAHWLLDRGHPTDVEYVHNSLYNPDFIRRRGSVIKNDLEEVANSWSKEGFDLWEEVDGRHLWTDAASRRALQAGAVLASRLEDTNAAKYYSQQADAIAAYLPVYRNTTSNTWRATANITNNRTGLDAAILLASIHTGSNGSAIDLSPSDPAVLATLEAYVHSFDGLYGVNNISSEAGWLVGRYAEDIYDGVGFTGGNPWYITTLAVAHVLYEAKRDFIDAGKIVASANFWSSNLLGLASLFDNTTQATWIAGSPEFDVALTALQRTGDAFLSRVADHTVDGRGRMSEQIGRDDGISRGARDLTWSYAAFLGAKRARDAAKGFDTEFLFN